MNGHGKIMVRVHQSMRRRDDAMAIGVGVVTGGNLKPFSETHEAGHRIGTRTIHPDLAVMIERHEAEGRIDPIVDKRQIETVALGDFLPVRKRRSAEWIDAD